MIKAKISDLIFDDKNFNIGNEYGNSLIEKSISKNGLGRGVLIDKNNKLIAGNKTVENAGALGFENIIIVETTGNELVVTKRVDIDLDSKQGRELALSDNATSKANLTWDYDILEANFDVKELNEWGLDFPNYEDISNPESNSNSNNEYLEVKVIIARSIKEADKMTDIYNLKAIEINQDIIDKLSKVKKVYIYE